MKIQNSRAWITASTLMLILSLPTAREGRAATPCPKNPAPHSVSFEQGRVRLAPTPASKLIVLLPVEIARTAEQQRLGLMYRPEIKKNWAMAFRYDEPTTMGIWMKNTCAPLDLLFFDSNHQLKKIVRNTTPFSLETHDSPGPISTVLELAAGEVDRLGIRAGWSLTFQPIQKEK
jgi:uncharacterized membrane protein (UPF0127 family)